MDEATINTGVEWIGDIPEHWDCEALRYLVGLNSRQSSYSSERPYIALENIESWTGIVVESDVEVSVDSSVNEFLAGDVLFGKLRPYLAKVVRTKYSGTSSMELLALTPSKLIQGYLFYTLLCKGFIDTVDSQTYGVKMPRTSWEQLRVMRFPVPPADEQVRIVEQLDTECGRIDQMISIIEEQVKVLDSYRKSLIQETVTCGLDPNAEMKPTGYEYIGDIPSAWALSPLLYLGAMQNGISKDGDSFGSGYPFVSYGDVYRNVFLPHSVEGLVESNSEERYRYSVKKNDAFFTRTSETIDEIGFTSVCTKTIENATFAGFLIRFRPTSDQLNMRYAAYYFRSENLRAYFAREMVSVTRASLSQNLLGRLVVPLPPLDEQERIADFLDEKYSTVERLIEGKRKQLETLRAQRQSLIYEYVTGKRRVV